MAVTGNVTGTVTVSAAIRQSGKVGVDACTLSITQTGSNAVNPGVQLPAALAGTLSTYTDPTHGIVTASAPHGLAGTEKIGLFWLDPGTQAQKKAYGCAITAHDASTFTFTVGAGDSLPVVTTPLQFAVAQTLTDLVIPGTNLLQMMLTVSANGFAVLSDSTPTVRMAQWATTAAPYIFPTTVGQSSPFSQTVVSIDCYNAALTTSTMTVECLLA